MNLVHTSKEIQRLSTTNINWYFVFKEIIAVYSENHAETINTKFRFINFVGGGTYNLHCDLNG
jgi:hypothetical protein